MRMDFLLISMTPGFPGDFPRVKRWSRVLGVFWRCRLLLHTHWWTKTEREPRCLSGEELGLGLLGSLKDEVLDVHTQGTRGAWDPDSGALWRREPEFWAPRKSRLLVSREVGAFQWDRRGLQFRVPILRSVECSNRFKSWRRRERTRRNSQR